jgi:hypothetical protein
LRVFGKVFNSVTKIKLKPLDDIEISVLEFHDGEMSGGWAFVILV